MHQYTGGTASSDYTDYFYGKITHEHPHTIACMTSSPLPGPFPGATPPSFASCVGSALFSKHALVMAAGVVGTVVLVRGVSRLVSDMVSSEYVMKRAAATPEDDRGSMEDASAMASTLETERRNTALYVTKNLTKSAVLMALSPVSAYVSLEGWHGGRWHTDTIQTIGAIYASQDIAGLLVVPNLPLTTKVHHASVFALSLMNLAMDYRTPTIWRAAVINGSFSCFSYIVNGYLGTRLIKREGDETVDRMRALGGWIYLPSSLVNWALQVAVIRQALREGASPGWAQWLAYGALSAAIVRDDVILLKHLFSKKRDETPSRLSEASDRRASDAAEITTITPPVTPVKNVQPGTFWVNRSRLATPNAVTPSVGTTPNGSNFSTTPNQTACSSPVMVDRRSVRFDSHVAAAAVASEASEDPEWSGLLQESDDDRKSKERALEKACHEILLNQRKDVIHDVVPEDTV